MTWGDLETTVDTSDLSLRTHAVLSAFTHHVNPPTDKRPYPDNMIVWPSMEALVDLSRCSQAMVQRAKHELVEQGILELVRHAGRGKTPRYRINEQKIQRDEAVLERQQQRRARRGKGSHPAEGTPAKGSHACEPFSPKGSQPDELFGPKGSQDCEGEVFQSSTSPEETNFFQVPVDPASTPLTLDQKEMAHTRSQAYPKTKRRTPMGTLAPHDLPITPALEAWRDIEAPGLDLPHAIKKFLLYARGKGQMNIDWEAAFCFYALNGRDQQAALAQQQQAAAAVREAWQVERQAVQEVEPPGGADAWTDVHALGDGFYGTHVGGCGEPHQCNGPCPTAEKETTR